MKICINYIKISYKEKIKSKAFKFLNIKKCDVHEFLLILLKLHLQKDNLQFFIHAFNSSVLFHIL